MCIRILIMYSLFKCCFRFVSPTQNLKCFSQSEDRRASGVNETNLMLLNSKGEITFFFTFTGPCIVLYFYSKSNQMHQFLKFILFWNKRYCCLLARK
jgi:hypothetical protein